MKLALEVAIGVVLGGLALDGIHGAQRIVRSHSELMAATKTTTVQSTAVPESDIQIPKIRTDERDARDINPEAQAQINGWPGRGPKPITTEEAQRWNAETDAAAERQAPPRP